MPSDANAAPQLTLVPPPRLSELGRQSTTDFSDMDTTDFLDSVGEPDRRRVRFSFDNLRLPVNRALIDELDLEQSDSETEGEEEEDDWEHECMCNDPECDCIAS